ncbi:hypothetical protein NG800_006015 [Epilithonimonas ginsengisoli]|uniref:SH3 domain-containing protein n=2 Tax=Epilithonimonas ginsengisoli TaxID=1245592 RepID=A0ABU4JFJ8_9FLAO|nr:MULTISPECIES: hypothetical protein [Chryseobacterium group]MDW8548455.1 hypothetical protein [Epilithonimonas ginsengisoli]OAH75753.1 hypothetical protein AXA65_02745 [Chryseobacterium sp. FP211-J200]
MSPAIFGQFAIVSDKDGFVNVRTTAEIGNNISDKLENGFVVYSFEPNGNWINIDYKKKGKELGGYIYKDRIKFVTDFIKIPQKSQNDGILKLGNDQIKIEIRETKFIKENHKLTFVKNSNTLLDKIDGYQIFGADGNIPRRQYKSIKVKINKTEIELPNIALKNLYEPNLANHQATYDEKNDTLYIFSMNSDGAGSYEVIWVIEKNKFKERIEAYGF